MAFTGVEVTSRVVSNDGIERGYYLHGPGDEEDVADFVLTLPSDIADFPFADFDGKEVEAIPGDFELTVKWGSSNSSPNNTPGTSAYRFNFQAPSGHIRRSLVTIAAYEDSTIFPFGAPPMNGAINVVDYGTADVRTEGFNLQAPAEVFSIPYTDVDAVISSAYQATVRDLCGKVNSATFNGIGAGQLMLVRATGERKGGLWNLEFGFGYIKNATSIPVGDTIVVTSKDGMDLLWVLEVTKVDGTSKSRVNAPACAYIERVFERADLTALDLP